MLNIKKISFLLFSLSVYTMDAFAQNVVELDTVFTLIEQQNPELKIYDEQLKKQTALTEGAKAWKAPMVSVGSFMTPYNNFGRANNLRDGAFMISAEQMILNKSKKDSESDFLAAQNAITIAKKATSLNELKAIARTNYYNAVLETKRLEFIEKDIIIIENLIKLAKIRYTYNKAELADIYSLEAKKHEALNKQTASLAKQHIAKIRLNVLMNRPYNQALALDTSTISSSYLISENIDTDIQNNSLIKNLDAQYQSLALEKKMLNTEAKPEFSIQFSHMIPYNQMMPNQFTVMAGMSLPFLPWASKSYKSKLKANQFEMDAITQEKHNLSNNLAGMIKSQEQHLNHLKSELEVYEEHIFPSLKSAFDITMLNYQENKADLAKVIATWKEQNEAHLNYLNLYAEFLDMYVEYEKNLERN